MAAVDLLGLRADKTDRRVESAVKRYETSVFDVAIRSDCCALVRYVSFGRIESGRELD